VNASYALASCLTRATFLCTLRWRLAHTGGLYVGHGAALKGLGRHGACDEQGVMSQGSCGVLTGGEAGPEPGPRHELLRGANLSSM